MFTQQVVVAAIAFQFKSYDLEKGGHNSLVVVSQSVANTLFENGIANALFILSANDAESPEADDQGEAPSVDADREPNAM